MGGSGGCLNLLFSVLLDDERLPGLDERLESGKDLRPAMLDREVRRGLAVELVVDECQAAGVAHLLDLPRDAARLLGRHLGRVERGEGVDQPMGWIDLEDLAVERNLAVIEVDKLRAGLPVRPDLGAEVVLASVG